MTNTLARYTEYTTQKNRHLEQSWSTEWVAHVAQWGSNAHTHKAHNSVLYTLDCTVETESTQENCVDSTIAWRREKEKLKVEIDKRWKMWTIDALVSPIGKTKNAGAL